jgi:hypothetical protein
MSDQMRLLASMNLIDDLLNGPTTLSNKSQKAAAALALNIKKRCWFNAGWHAANPTLYLKGIASTSSLFDEIAPLLDLLQARRTKKRSRGAPRKDTIKRQNVFIIREYLMDRRGESLASIIDGGVRDGRYLLGKNTTTAAYVKQINREIKKLEMISAKDSAFFRPRKRWPTIPQ